ncbi:GyrI-like domain-containing protein [Amycolatopsis sp. cg5]|uniref:GyrI-like domain-containing protein n=1 Tax=Amycolatopsis sp. cg5 TaxID=3238802 RepID=UPI0035235410
MEELNMRIEDRPAQHYVAIKRTISMNDFPEIADKLPVVIGWLTGRGVAPASAPFFKYNALDMPDRLEVEAGVPVAAPVDGDGEIFAGVLPAGRYAVHTHHGHPDKLADATGKLLADAAEQDLRWDVTDSDGVETWAARLEVYKTHPAEQPDWNKWETDIVIKLAD